MGRILIIRGGAIGDFILTLPVLAALRGQFPRTRIEVLGYPNIARLALIGGLADAVHAIEARALAGFFARRGTLDPAMTQFFTEFGVIVSYLYDPDGIFRENVERGHGRTQFIEGPHRPDEKGTRHATEAFLEPLQRLAIFDSDARPALHPAPTPPGPGRWLAVHPGSGSETKNWPERLWIELLGRVILETEANLLLVGGEAEGERLARIAAHLPTRRIMLARSQPLDQLAGLLAGCHHFVGHDSGISHLAAAVRLPCLVLWGPTNAAIWSPRGERVSLLRDDRGLAGLDLETVWTVLRHPISNPALRPPQNHGSAPSAIP